MGIKLIVFLIFLVVATCNNQEVINHLTKENQNQHVKIRQQQEFTVTLPANPTTGYTWSVADSNTIHIQAIETVKYTAHSKKIGAGGDQEFRFKATEPGTSTLKLIYHRPWEKDVAPVDSFTVTIEIVKDKASK